MRLTERCLFVWPMTFVALIFFIFIFCFISSQMTVRFFLQSIRELVCFLAFFFILFFKLLLFNCEFLKAFAKNLIVLQIS